MDTRRGKIYPLEWKRWEEGTLRMDIRKDDSEE